MTNILELQLIKMSACKNDFLFIYYDQIKKKNFNLSDFRKLVQKLCDRYIGIGADGLVMWSYKNQKFEIIIFNSDGTIAETCGNALRCVARLAEIEAVQKSFNHNIYRLSPQNIFIQNYELFDTELFAEKDEIISEILSISDDIIDINFNNEKDITNYSEKLINLTNYLNNEFQLNIKNLSCFFVDLNNPHLVLISDSFLNINKLLVENIGIYLQQNSYLIDSKIPCSNISLLAQKKNNIYSLLVYERGAGLTMGCGSASVASAIALDYLAKNKNNYTFLLLGGELNVKYCSQNNVRILSGNAHIIAEISVDLYIS